MLSKKKREYSRLNPDFENDKELHQRSNSFTWQNFNAILQLTAFVSTNGIDNFYIYWCNLRQLLYVLLQLKTSFVAILQWITYCALLQL